MAFPELWPESKREAGRIEDLDVVEECVGLRPTRKGGVRLDVAALGTFPIRYPYHTDNLWKIWATRPFRSYTIMGERT